MKPKTKSKQNILKRFYKTNFQLTTERDGRISASYFAFGFLFAVLWCGTLYLVTPRETVNSCEYEEVSRWTR